MGQVSTGQLAGIPNERPKKKGWTSFWRETRGLVALGFGVRLGLFELGHG